MRGCVDLCGIVVGLLERLAASERGGAVSGGKVRAPFSVACLSEY